jgi:hypothetical protein
MCTTLDFRLRRHHHEVPISSSSCAAPWSQSISCLLETLLSTRCEINGGDFDVSSPSIQLEKFPFRYPSSPGPSSFIHTQCVAVFGRDDHDEAEEKVHVPSIMALEGTYCGSYY